LTPSSSLCKPPKRDILCGCDTRPKGSNPVLLGSKYKAQNCSTWLKKYKAQNKFYTTIQFLHIEVLYYWCSKYSRVIFFKVELEPKSSFKGSHKSNWAQTPYKLLIKTLTLWPLYFYLQCCRQSPSLSQNQFCAILCRFRVSASITF